MTASGLSSFLKSVVYVVIAAFTWASLVWCSQSLLDLTLGSEPGISIPTLYCEINPPLSVSLGLRWPLTCEKGLQTHGKSCWVSRKLPRPSHTLTWTHVEVGQRRTSSRRATAGAGRDLNGPETIVKTKGCGHLKLPGIAITTNPWLETHRQPFWREICTEPLVLAAARQPSWQLRPGCGWGLVGGGLAHWYQIVFAHQVPLG